MKIGADIDELVKLVSSATDAYTTAFFLADNQKQMLKLWHYFTLSDYLITDASIPFGVGPIGRVAENMKLYELTKFTDRDSRMLKIYSRNEEIKAFCAIPVISEGVLEGVLCIDSKSSNDFAIKDQKLLSLFAKQFADLMNNLRVKKFVNTETSDVSFLHNFSSQIASADNEEAILKLTFDSVAQLVECDSHFLCMAVDNENRQFSIEMTDSNRNVSGMIFLDQDCIAGRVIRDREPILLNNRQRDLGPFIFAFAKAVGSVRSFLGVPLLTKDDALGVICLLDSSDHSFNQRDMRVISIIANNASIALASAKAREKVHRLSTTVDGLTGLYSFSGFRERLDMAFQEANRKRKHLSLVIMDINGFGEINNLSGYETGNEVLRRLAQLLTDLSVDESVSAARCGSDEFAMILPGVSMDRAILMAEKIRRTIQSPTFIPPGYGVNISISTGVSSFPNNSRSCNELIDHALRTLS
jgi:diguanylate cyclase (GGDEF)-like protein